MRMLRIALLPLLLPLLTYAQGVPDDGLTDSTEALQSALDTGHLHLAGDPLGAGAQITAIIADGAEKVVSVSLRGVIYRYAFTPNFSPINASLAYAVAFVLLHFVIAWAMWRKKWFVKV